MPATTESCSAKHGRWAIGIVAAVLAVTVTVNYYISRAIAEAAVSIEPRVRTIETQQAGQQVLLHRIDNRLERIETRLDNPHRSSP